MAGLLGVHQIVGKWDSTVNKLSKWLARYQEVVSDFSNSWQGYLTG